MLDKYTPRPLTGYTFYSNYGSHATTGSEHTREFVQHLVSSSFDIPVDHVWVEPFRVVDCPDKYIAWAAYVRNDHAAKVHARLEDLRDKLKVLSLLQGTRSSWFGGAAG